MKFNIGGKERGVQFGMGAIQIYCDEMDCDVEGLNHITGGKRQFKAIASIVFGGLSNHCNLNDELIDFNPNTVSSWIDEMSQEDYNSLMGHFKNSKVFGKSIQQHFNDVNGIDEETTQPNKAKKKA